MCREENCKITGMPSYVKKKRSGDKTTKAAGVTKVIKSNKTTGKRGNVTISINKQYCDINDAIRYAKLGNLRVDGVCYGEVFEFKGALFINKETGPEPLTVQMRRGYEYRSYMNILKALTPMAE